jgi:predicted PurR-regulated permease PerM
MAEQPKPHSSGSVTPVIVMPGASTLTRILVPLACFVIVVAGMKAAASIVVPFLIAVFLAVIAAPALFWLKKKRISTVPAILIISLIILICGLLAGTLLATSIANFTLEVPAYQEKLQEWIDSLSDPNEILQGIYPEPSEESPAVPPPQEGTNSEFKIKMRRHLHEYISESRESIRQYVNAGRIIGIFGDMLTQVGGILANGFMIYVTMVFILLEASVLPSKIKAALKNSPETYQNLSKVGDNLNRYMVLKTLLSLATGVLVAAWLMLLGVKYAVLWGLIAFLLNFIPNIGSIIAAIPAIILTLLQLGPVSALLTAAGYLVINIAIGNFIEPRLMGQRLGLSTLVVFLSLIFWVLGPVGMILSVPLTMLFKIVLQSREDTRWIALLLGGEQPSNADIKPKT